jgi:mono/diheme cytochrome c family protein
MFSAWTSFTFDNPPLKKILAFMPPQNSFRHRFLARRGWIAFWLCLLSWPLTAQDGFADSAAQKNGCGQCHRLTADEPQEDKPAPDLFYAGNKFQKSWLQRFLQNPEILREAGDIRDPGFLQGGDPQRPPHPALSAPRAAAVADDLMRLKLADLEGGALDGQPLTRSARAQARILFDRTYGCISCHRALNLVGKVRGGVSGPSLVDAGNRLQANWIYQRIKHPEKLQNQSRMPVFQLEEDALVQLVRFIASMKKEEMK